LHGAFDLLDDADMPEFARTLLAQKVFNPSIRNNIQDLLWADEPIIDIPKRHRRELAEALQPFELFGHWENFKRLLNDLFVFPLDLSEMFSIHETGILGEIHRHFVRNPEDGDVAWLFENYR
jgi:hypothetical protein